MAAYRHPVIPRSTYRVIWRAIRGQPAGGGSCRRVPSSGSGYPYWGGSFGEKEHCRVQLQLTESKQPLPLCGVGGDVALEDLGVGKAFPEER